MNGPGNTAADKKDIPAQLRAETIAYALQHGLLNLAANFVEPYINLQTQKYYSHKYAPPAKPGTPPAKPLPHGDYTQNLAGEFAGDIIGMGTLITAEMLFPRQLHQCTKAIRSWLDPLYTTVAHKALAKEKGAPDYEKKVEEWKTFQERNMARTLIMMAAGIAGNVATQKLLIKNPSPASVIFKGKLLSTTITNAVGLATRLAYPKQMNHVDEWMGKNIFAPMLNDVTHVAEKTDMSHTERLAHNNKAMDLTPAGK